MREAEPIGASEKRSDHASSAVSAGMILPLEVLDGDDLGLERPFGDDVARIVASRHAPGLPAGARGILLLVQTFGDAMQHAVLPRLSMPATGLPETSWVPVSR